MVAGNISKGIILTFNGANKNCQEYCKKVKGKQMKIEYIEIINLMDLLEQCSEIDAKEILEVLELERETLDNIEYKA